MRPFFIAGGHRWLPADVMGDPAATSQRRLPGQGGAVPFAGADTHGPQEVHLSVGVFDIARPVIALSQRGHTAAHSCRRRVASHESDSVHMARPNKAMSFIRNSPLSDNTGNPPAVGSPIPGVEIMKLSVPRKNRVARTPPRTDNRGDHGLTASNAAVASSATPVSAPNVLMDMRL